MTLTHQQGIASPMGFNKSTTVAQISGKLLGWYDKHARDLPWRVSPADRKAGILPDPYHVWLSEVMLQQTTVVTVGPYFLNFLGRWPSVQDLAAADDADVMGEWAGLGYYARARNLLKCARVVSADLAGIFPSNEPELLKLPGIGPYTAAAILTIAFNLPATVMDGNIERVMARLFEVTVPLPNCKPALYKLAEQATPEKRVGDYVQAVMDLGATVCTPRSPKCGSCPLATICAVGDTGLAETLPKRKPKAAKPTRNGIAYFAYTAATQVLLETRPDKGLLGGMLALPSNEWVEGAATADPPTTADWQELPEQVRHVFTHFNLNLTVAVAQVSGQNPTRGVFVDFPDPLTLPTVMRKAYKIALKSVQISPQSGEPGENLK